MGVDQGDAVDHVTPARSRSNVPLDLAGGRLRKLVEDEHPPGPLEAREAAAAVLDERLGVDRPRGDRHDAGHRLDEPVGCASRRRPRPRARPGARSARLRLRPARPTHRRPCRRSARRSRSPSSASAGSRTRCRPSGPWPRGTATSSASSAARSPTPDFAAKAPAGATEEIRLCLSCNQECVGRMGLNRWLGCIENPRTGRERRVVGQPADAPPGARRRRRAGRAAGGDQRGPSWPRRHGARAPGRPGRTDAAGCVRAQPGRAGRHGPQPGDGVPAPRRDDRARRARPPSSRCGRRRADHVVVATGAVASRPWWVGGDVANACDIREVLTGDAAPAGDVVRDRRDRVPPRHVGRRAVRRPGLRWRSSHRGWWSVRTSASHSTWSSGGSAPGPRASSSRPISCRWASTARRSRCCTTRPAPTSSARPTGSCWRSRPFPTSSCTSTSGRPA